MKYTGMFINGTQTLLGDGCADWCREQHYIFNNNEMITSLWILAIALFVLIVYWAFRNCPEDKYNEFLISTGLRKDQLERILYSLIPLAMLLIVIFLIYFPMRFL